MTDLLAQSLQRCTVESLAFPVTVSEQQGARGVVEHEQWRRDGAELGDTGRKAYRGKLTAVFVQGLSGWPDALWPDTFSALVGVFENRPDDLRLAHPLLGTFLVRVPSWTPRIDPSVRNGAFLDFDWIEQRASSVGVVAPLLPSADVVDALDTAAASADAALAGAGLVTTLATAASTVRRALGTALAPVGEVQGAIGAMRRQIDDATRLLSAQALTSTTRSLVHAGRAAAAQCKGALARVSAQVSDPVGVGQRVTTERAMTCAELSSIKYGTPFKAGLLRTANGFASDTIPAGTTVTIP